MGKLLTAMKASWKAATTAEKINLVLDILCGVGCGIMSVDVCHRILPGHNKVEKVCLAVVTDGICLAAGTAASKALMDNYGTFAAGFIDRAKAKKAAEAQKEAGKNE